MEQVGKPPSGLRSWPAASWTHCSDPLLVEISDEGTYTRQQAGFCHIVALWSLHRRMLTALLVAYRCSLLTALSLPFAPQGLFPLLLLLGVHAA